jgi:hypothetical protein
MKKILLLPILLLLTVFSCKENPTAPLIDDLQPGSRDYIWTVDTLYAEDYFSIAAMWGSSANDIWAVAVGTSSKDCLWHYDTKILFSSTQLNEQIAATLKDYGDAIRHRDEAFDGPEGLSVRTISMRNYFASFEGDKKNSEYIEFNQALKGV